MVWWCLASVLFTYLYTSITPSGSVAVTILSGFIMYQIMVIIPFLLIFGFNRLVMMDRRPANQFTRAAIIPSIVLAALFFYFLWPAARVK